LVRYEQAPVAVLLASAPEAATAVARTVLGPVLALPAAECDVLLATLRAWFAAHGATSLAAERLHVHRNTVRYRLKRLEDLPARAPPRRPARHRRVRRRAAGVAAVGHHGVRAGGVHADGTARCVRAGVVRARARRSVAGAGVRPRTGGCGRRRGAGRVPARAR